MAVVALSEIIVGLRSMASDYLIRERELQFADLQPALERGEQLEQVIRQREELAEHKRALVQIERDGGELRL
ncbi:hypothetical protein ACLK2C_16640 [Escherichia coli]